jgi:hypothetical protein
MKNRIAFYVLSLAVLIFGASAASAKPVTLACGPTSDNRVGHSFIHFDENEGTAGSGSVDKPDYYTGSNPATFSSTEIKWKAVIDNSVEYTQLWYVLNRMTGELTVTVDSHGDRLSPHYNTYYCSAVQAQF